VIDLNQNICLVFAKKGFNLDFLSADASLRRQFEFLPVPKVLQYEQGQSWFVEELISGLPLNRLPSQSLRESVLRRAEKSMVELYEVSAKTEKLDQYSHKVELEIRHQLTEISGEIAEREHGELEDFLKLLISRLSGRQKLDSDIALAVTHGDFQAANILWDQAQKKLWLIDWEYSGIRSVYFDAFCMRLNSRFYAGLGQRVEKLLTEMCDNLLFTHLTVPVGKGDTSMLWLFLLEEFLLKLTEISTPEIHCKMDAVLPWVREISAVKVAQEVL
jgi:aminoglycoside phosphotransferase